MLELLPHLASAVAQAGMTRSAFIQEATGHYLARLEYDVEREARAKRVERAIAGMREIGESLPSGADGVRLIRHTRDTVPGWAACGPLGQDE